MDMLALATKAFLARAVCCGFNWGFFHCMTDRPLVIGAFTGLLMGDLKLGIIMGGVLEAVFMGAVDIGGARSADSSTATVFAVTFAAGMGMEQGAAILAAIPIGIACTLITSSSDVLTMIFAPWFNKLCKEGNTKQYPIFEVVSWIFNTAYSALPAFLGIWLGGTAFTNLAENLPPILTQALSCCTGLLPAVGFAILLKMLWTSSECPFFFVGFVFAIYLGLPMVAIAVIGIALAILVSLHDFRDFQNSQRCTVATTNTIQSEEEAFFE